MKEYDDIVTIISDSYHNLRYWATKRSKSYMNRISSYPDDLDDILSAEALFNMAMRLHGVS